MRAASFRQRSGIGSAKPLEFELFGTICGLGHTKHLLFCNTVLVAAHRIAFCGGTAQDGKPLA
jgi:hypothetical protein